ncbi:MAG: hypothetical protein ABGY24_02510 [bacterium]
MVLTTELLPLSKAFFAIGSSLLLTSAAYEYVPSTSGAGPSLSCPSSHSPCTSPHLMLGTSSIPTRRSPACLRNGYRRPRTCATATLTAWPLTPTSS